MTVASAAAITMVLGDHNLLCEILLRLAFPASLVRGAAVCKRWLRAASDPAFLRRFRDLHPPRLVGFYVTAHSRARGNFGVDFVPMQPQPPEPAAVLCGARFGLDAYVSESTRVMDCRNGSVVAKLFRGGDFTHGVHNPLCPARGFVPFPSPPMTNVMEGRSWIFQEVLLKESGDEMSYIWFTLDYCNQEETATACVHMLQDDDYAWRMHSSASTQIPMLDTLKLKTMSVFLADDKIYIGITMHGILVLDLTSSSFSTIQFHENMQLDGEVRLARADGSGVYLLLMKDLQLCIWLCRGGNGGIGDWVLTDTIYLHGMCSDLKIANHMIGDGHTPIVYIHEVGDNAEFVFLEIFGRVLYLDVRARVLQKVCEVTEKGKTVCWIHPFMMTWPFIFPALKDE